MTVQPAAVARRACSRAEGNGRRLALAVLGACAAVGAWGGVSLRGLAGDGAAYLFGLIAGERPMLQEPARLTAQLLQQLPALVLTRLHAGDLAGIERAWSLWLELLPVLLVAASIRIMPRDRRSLGLFPVLHLLAGTMAGAAYPMAEGAVAAAYFWLLLACVEFGGARPMGRALVALVALPAPILHESFVLLAPLLVVAGRLRARDERDPGMRRFVLALTVWFGVATAYQLRWMVFPHKPFERRILSHQILRLWFVTDGYAVNVAALLGLLGLALALALIASAWWPRAVPAVRWRRSAAGLFAALCVAAALAATLSPRFTPPWLQFSGRTVAALVSVPLGLAAIVAWRRPALPLWSAPALRATVLALAAAQLVCHTAEIARWRAGVAALRQVVQVRQGFVPWQSALAGLSARPAAAVQLVAGGWTTPALSVLLAPQGRVRAVVGAAPDPRAPHRAVEAFAVPASRFWDASAYAAAREGRPGE